METLFIGLRIDAGGTLEIAAEIGSSRETELIRGFLYCLFGVGIYEQFGLSQRLMKHIIFMTKDVVFPSKNRTLHKDMLDAGFHEGFTNGMEAETLVEGDGGHLRVKAKDG